MNRKLHNSLLAFSASGLMLALGLMVASPAPRGLAQIAPSHAATSTRQAIATLASDAESASIDSAEAHADALATRIDARADALEAELGQDASVGDTLASVMSFAAEVSADAAIVSAIGEAAAADHTARQAEKTEEARHERRFRSALAVPYFSFAQRLRGSRS
jgi:hypothetical protein